MTDETAQPIHFRDRLSGLAIGPDLLARVRSADAAATGELFRTLSAGLKLLIRRRLGAEGLDDRVREVFMEVVEGIQRDSVPTAETLPSFVRATLQRLLAGCAGDEPAPAPHAPASGGQNSVQAMREMLESLPEHEREALTRFYVLEQPAEQVIDEVGVSAADFRAIKTRARARFVEMRRAVRSESAE